MVFLLGFEFCISGLVIFDGIVEGLWDKEWFIVFCDYVIDMLEYFKKYFF